MQVRILNPLNRRELTHALRQLDVDPYGIRIMTPKALGLLVSVRDIRPAAATILKQEMLSLGGDAAVPRGVLTGKIKSADCLLMGTLTQVTRLEDKLRAQPFGLRPLAGQIRQALRAWQEPAATVRMGRFTLRCAQRPCLMGVINVTPDSFSGDGLCREPDPVRAGLRLAEQMVKDGADIIDVGGESNRPQSRPVSAAEEARRVVPVIRAICRSLRVPVSADTCKPAVAGQALDAGACMVNDITGLRAPAMRRLVARYRAAAVIMHMRGCPATMQRSPGYDDVVTEVTAWLAQSVEKARSSGIPADRLIIDPGIGFGKSLEHNLSLLRRLREMTVAGAPIMVGTSRKSFIGRITGAGPDQRLAGTIASCVLAYENGARFFRVHDVKPVRQALQVAHAIRRLNKQDYAHA